MVWMHSLVDTKKNSLRIFGKEYKPCNFSCNFIQPCVISSLLVPNIVLSTLFSYRLSLCSSLDVINQVSCPQNMQNYSSLNFNNCVFTAWTEKMQAFFKCNNFTGNEILICVNPKHVNLATISNNLLLILVSNLLLPTDDMNIFLSFSAFTSRPASSD